MTTVLSDTRVNNDDIFTGANNPNPTSGRNIRTSSRNDLFYNKPDIGIYYIKNCAPSILALKDGIPISIRHNNNINRNFTTSICEGEKGIFVVKYYHFYKGETDIHMLSNYVNKTVLDLGLNSGIEDEIQSRILKFATELDKKDECIRLIQFIPLSTISKNGIYMDKFSNTKFILDALNRNNFNIDVTYDTTLELTISGGSQACYYLALGKEVIPIYTKDSISGEFKGVLSVASNDATILKKDLCHKNLNDIGLYASKEAAERSTDIDSLLEVKKLMFKEKTLANEIELSKHSNRSKIATIVSENVKRKIDMDMYVFKVQAERFKLMQSQLPVLKSALELGYKVVTNILR